jgi:aminoglycoside phosphotransferase (APT) family kinase protein
VGAVGIVHGDYRSESGLVTAQGRIGAISDWEPV